MSSLPNKAMKLTVAFGARSLSPIRWAARRSLEPLGFSFTSIARVEGR
jgi:hypothetical protein